jgi:hypothetical protein
MAVYQGPVSMPVYQAPTGALGPVSDNRQGSANADSRLFRTSGILIYQAEGLTEPDSTILKQRSLMKDI